MIIVYDILVRKPKGENQTGEPPIDSKLISKCILEYMNRLNNDRV
jgi:hypothetical protein